MSFDNRFKYYDRGYTAIMTGNYLCIKRWSYALDHKDRNLCLRILHQHLYLMYYENNNDILDCMHLCHKQGVFHHQFELIHECSFDNHPEIVAKYLDFNIA